MVTRRTHLSQMPQPIRTDVSEDLKGDPTKTILNQPLPGQKTDSDPVFPAPDGPRPDPSIQPERETPADRVARKGQREGQPTTTK